jgi:hypothetical protein
MTILNFKIVNKCQPQLDFDGDFSECATEFYKTIVQNCLLI